MSYAHREQAVIAILDGRWRRYNDSLPMLFFGISKRGSLTIPNSDYDRTI
jgi:hypothetical protein